MFKYINELERISLALNVIDYLTRVRPSYAMSYERPNPSSTQVRLALLCACENGYNIIIVTANRFTVSGQLTLYMSICHQSVMLTTC